MATPLSVIAWNMQGNPNRGVPAKPRLELAWTDFKADADAAAKSVLGLFCEASYAPFIRKDPDSEYILAKPYTLRGNDRAPWFDTAAANASQICQDVLAAGGDMAWVPWAKTLDGDGHPQLRCSMLGFIYPAKGSGVKAEFARLPLENFATRPALTATVSVGPNPKATFFSLHLPSGVAPYAAKLLGGQLVKAAAASGMAGVSLQMLLGDMNMDPAYFPAPRGWLPITTGKVTHQGGSELDWGMSRTVGAAPDPDAEIYKQFQTDPPNLLTYWSDHASVIYDVSLV